MDEYLEYQSYICEVPEFIKKYLELDILKRLEDVSVLCGMDYASKDMYDFKFYLSRYNHSLNVALLTWKLTYNKTQTLAALFHDISTPVFSHVIDYMHGDYIQQESTEGKTKEVLCSSLQLLEYLKEDNIDINSIINFKKYSIVDLPRPSLCADRLDNIIAVGMCWAKQVDLRNAKRIIDNILICKNENDQDEIGLRNKNVARYVTHINYELNKLTHSSEDTYMMMLLSDIVRLILEERIVSYNDLYRLTEPEMIKIIENNLDNYELNDMYYNWTHIKELPSEPNIEVKRLTLNPLVNGNRFK